MRPVPVPVHWLFTPGQPGPDRRQSESRQVLLFHVDLSPVTGRSQCVKTFLGWGGGEGRARTRVEGILGLEEKNPAGSGMDRCGSRRREGEGLVSIFEASPPSAPPIFGGPGLSWRGKRGDTHAIHSSDAGLTWRLHRCDGGEVVIYPSFPSYAFQESLPRDIPLPLHCKYQIDSTPPSNTTEQKKQRETAPTSEQPDTSLIRFSWLRSQRTSRS